MSMTPEGWYDAKLIKSTDPETGEVAWFHWGKTDKGTPYIKGTIEITEEPYEGRKRTIDMYLSDKAKPYTAEKLAVFGWDGDGDMEQQDLGGPVRICIDHEEGQNDASKLFEKVAQVIASGGGGGGGGSRAVKNRMNEADKRGFAAQMRSEVKAIVMPAPKPAAHAQPADAPSLNPWDPGYVNPNDDLPS